MATFTWTWEQDDEVTAYKGTDNSSRTLSLPNSTVLSDSYYKVESVSYRVYVYNTTTSSSSITFYLNNIGVQNGPYDKASYGSSVSTSNCACKFTTTVTNTEQPKDYEAGGTDWNYKVWTSGDVTRAIFSGQFDNITTLSGIYDTSTIATTARAQSSLSGTTYIRKIEVIAHVGKRCGPGTDLKLSTSSTSLGFNQTATLSWTAGSPGYDVNGNTINISDYRIARKASTETSYTQIGTVGSADTNFDITAPTTAGTYSYYVVSVADTTASGYGSALFKGNGIQITVSQPSLNTQAQINSLVNSQKGTNITVTCTAATFDYQCYIDGYQIYYQWSCAIENDFSKRIICGVNNNTSYLFTEQNLLDCGALGNSTNGTLIYFFVRAYDGNYNIVTESASDTNKCYGLADVIGTSINFYYFPTVNSPSDFSLKSTSDNLVQISWTNVPASNGQNCNTYLKVDDSIIIDSNNLPINIFSNYAGYTLDQNFWENYKQGSHTIAIGHEWYGTYTWTSNLVFTNADGNFVYYYDKTEGWIQCIPYYYNGTTWIQCIPYYYDNGWQLCK